MFPVIAELGDCPHAASVPLRRVHGQSCSSVRGSECSAPAETSFQPEQLHARHVLFTIQCCCFSHLSTAKKTKSSRAVTSPVPTEFLALEKPLCLFSQRKRKHPSCSCRAGAASLAAETSDGELRYCTAAVFRDSSKVRALLCWGPYAYLIKGSPYSQQLTINRDKSGKRWEKIHFYPIPAFKCNIRLEPPPE